MSPFLFFEKPYSASKMLRDLKKQPASHWEKEGEFFALRLFRYAAQNVPAYKNFLKKHHIDSRRIRTIKDFQTVPCTDKYSYVRAHALPDLLPHRDTSLITTICSTSGTTGDPTYFPRGEEQDWQYEYVAELFLRNQFEIEKKTTLGVIGFALGIWIGGIFTYKNFNSIARKGYKLALAPTGMNRDILFATVKKMGHHFDQILLMGYPPFLKDLIDEGHEYGVDWKDYRTKIITATESFSEKFRDHIVRKAHIKNRYTDTLNIYGTVELGTMAHETPLTNLIRHIASRKSKVFASIFSGSDVMPTLAQYHPYLTYFEEVDGELFGTGVGSAYPLLRYRFFDKGMVIPYEVMLEKLRAGGIDMAAECKKAGIEKTLMKLPFVAVFERSDYVVILRGANVYPQNVRNALFRKETERYISGRFTMHKKENNRHDEYMEINIELKKGVKPALFLKKRLAQYVVDGLRKENSEFNNSYIMEGRKKMEPKIILYPYEHPAYFSRGAKQKWVEK